MSGTATLVAPVSPARSLSSSSSSSSYPPSSSSRSPRASLPASPGHPRGTGRPVKPASSFEGARRTPAPPGLTTNAKPKGPKDFGGAEHDILFQKFFKSVGPRTYAAQVKRARTGNHYLVLTEGKRDEQSADVRKTRLFVYGEDFVEFFRLLKSAAEFIKANPVSPEVERKQAMYWAKKNAKAGRNAPAPRPEPAGGRAGTR